jgi:transmembrane sensor
MSAESDTQIYDMAAIWAERLMADAPLDAAAQRELEAWLARDVRHQDALNTCLELEGMLDAARDSEWADALIAAAETELGPAPASGSAPGARPARTWAVPALIGMAAMLALAVGLPVWMGLMREPVPAQTDRDIVAQADETYVTARGERREIALADGSIVTLNTGSRLSTAFSGNERRVVLDAGEALFDVVRNPARPFVVEAGGHEVRAVGTAFNVYSRPDGRTLVTVVEGLVETRVDRGPASAALLRAGDQVELTPGEPAPEPSRVDVAAATAWRQGMLIFNDRALGEIVSEFRRYNDIEIAFADPALARLRMSGSFDPADTEAFFAALEATGSVHLERSGRGAVVHQATATND